MKGTLYAPRCGFAHNLLDNSDFTNPVNQRGATSYTENGYTIDRWKLYSGAVSIVGGQYVAASGQMYQLISGLDLEKTYTFAIENDAGIGVVCGKPSVLTEATIGNATIKIASMDSLAEVVIQPTEGYDETNVYWAALYEGSYTSDTLPPYVPKGYAAELAECKRYFYWIGAEKWMKCSFIRGWGKVVEIDLPIPMRAQPTVITDEPKIYTPSGWISATSVNADSYNRSNKMCINFVAADVPDSYAGNALIATGVVALSSDL